jgi:hypothetical protein
MGGWVGGWMEGKAGLRIAYSNQKLLKLQFNVLSIEFGKNMFRLFTNILSSNAFQKLGIATLANK